MNVDDILLHIFTCKELALFAKLQVSQINNIMTLSLLSIVAQSNFKPLTLEQLKDCSLSKETFSLNTSNHSSTYFIIISFLL